jgi:hypothetical protein
MGKLLQRQAASSTRLVAYMYSYLLPRHSAELKITDVLQYRKKGNICLQSMPLIDVHNYKAANKCCSHLLTTAWLFQQVQSSESTNTAASPGIIMHPSDANPAPSAPVKPMIHGDCWHIIAHRHNAVVFSIHVSNRERTIAPAIAQLSLKYWSRRLPF